MTSQTGLLIIHDFLERHRTLIANFHYESRSARRNADRDRLPRDLKWEKLQQQLRWEKEKRKERTGRNR